MKRSDPEVTDNSDSEEELEKSEETEKKNNDVPFLDTFYGISSTNAKERALASQAMLHYCLLGPEANVKDAAYALKRLMNGLCSGRSGARQGNASALASFLQVAFRAGNEEEGTPNIQQIMKVDASFSDSDSLSVFEYVRQKLVVTTEVKEGKMKGQEERDHRFGQLFGILAIIRSSILIPLEESQHEEILQTACNLVTDLVQLYKHKKWMREPAAHAITTLLKSYYSVLSDPKSSKKTVIQDIVDHIVSEVLLKQMFSKGDNEEKEAMVDEEELLSSFSPEQIAIATNIQAHAEYHTQLQGPLSQAFFSVDIIPHIAAAVSETSCVTQPRTHLVWDALWLYLSESSSDSETKERNLDARCLRKCCPLSKESASEVIASVMKHIVGEQLLRLDRDEGGKATHERRALSLCIVRNLLGVEFVSSISGRTRIYVDTHTMENTVLSRAIVKRIFVDVLCAGSGKKDPEHLLKPLATQILENAVEALCRFPTERRLAFAKALLMVDPKFDLRTKSPIIARLLGFANNEVLPTGDQFALLEGSFGMSQELFVELCSQGSPMAKSALDLFVNITKAVLRVEKGELSGDMIDHRKRLLADILVTCAVPAFFDCSSINDKAIASSLKKSGEKLSSMPFLESARNQKNSELGKQIGKSIDLRAVLSTKFYSILTEVVSSDFHSTPSEDSDESRGSSVVTELADSLIRLEDCGAKRYAQMTIDSDDDDLDERALYAQIRQIAMNSVIDDSRKRFSVGCSSLGGTLFLLTMRTSASSAEDQEEDHPEMDQVSEILSDLAETQKAIEGEKLTTERLLDVCGILCDLLSQPESVLGGPCIRLVKEVSKQMWIGTLNIAAKQDGVNISQELLGTLLDSIGASSSTDIEDDEEDGPASGVFSSAEAMETLSDDESDEDSVKGEDPDRNEDMSTEDDVELDSTRLKTMLEQEDIDEEEEKELEHHAGADAALAKLIQMRKETRKEGKFEKEKEALIAQIRCSILLEIVLNGKPDGWGALVHAEHLVFLVLPLVKKHIVLQKGVNTIESKSAPHGERRGLLDRISSILRIKILKRKGASLHWLDSNNSHEMIPELASALFSIIRKPIATEDRDTCSLALNFAIRCSPNDQTREKLKDMYVEALDEWKNKKTTRLTASIFDDLIEQNVRFAVSEILGPLSAVSGSASSSFLVSEALRMIGVLYSKAGSPETEGVRAKVAEESPGVFLAFAGALQSEEMRKAKRSKEALKALEKVLAFLKTQEELRMDSTELKNLKDAVVAAGIESDSAAVKNQCDNLAEEIDFVVKLHSTAQNNDDRGMNTAESSKKKKKKKKKK